jgi:hypothetical protein
MDDELKQFYEILESLEKAVEDKTIGHATYYYNTYPTQIEHHYACHFTNKFFSVRFDFNVVRTFKFNWRKFKTEEVLHYQEGRFQLIGDDKGSCFHTVLYGDDVEIVEKLMQQCVEVSEENSELALQKRKQELLTIFLEQIEQEKKEINYYDR